MERRRFLRVLSGGLTGGALAGDRLAAWGQAVVPPDAAPPAAGQAAKAAVPEVPIASAPGVTAKGIKIGMSAAFKGSNAGVNPTRAGFRQALESLKGFDLGIGAPLTFGPERHQGLDSVYFTRVQNERWVPVADWTAAVRA
jgi:hypothetical protein